MKDIISKMTTEEKVGQLFLAHCPDEGAEELVSRLSAKVPDTTAGKTANSSECDGKWFARL